MPMRRISAVAFILAFSLSSLAHAQQYDHHALKGVKHRAPDHIEVRDDGLHILTYRHPDVSDDGRERQGRPKDILPYITYTWIVEPDIGGGIDCFDIAPLEFAPYWYAFILTNNSSRSIRGNVTFKLSGPTSWKRSFPNTRIRGRSFAVLYFEGDALRRVGEYMLKSTFKGAGSAKSRFCAGC